jgi:ubiquinone/menaquinone biosynthesis C-methylase UbiE
VAGGLSNREAWDQHAEAWIAWARAEGHDHFFWRFSMPALLELAPAPGRLTLDVASGEGRMARALRDAGHTVLAIESSPTLVRAARKADPRMEVLRANVTRLPMGAEIADLAVCSMALMDFDDLGGALREIARVLVPGGHVCASVSHPASSRKWVEHYFDTARFATPMERAGLQMTFESFHHTLDDYTRALEAAGFVIEALREPVPSRDYVSDHPEVARWREEPVLLTLRARRES